MKKQSSSKAKYSQIQFKLFTPEIHKHLIHVQMDVNVESGNGIYTFGMPVWTPGSYMVRNFSSNLVQIKPKGNQSEDVKIIQRDLSIFEIHTHKKQFSIEYIIYGYENTVRTNFIDPEYCFLNSTATFLYPIDQLNVEIFVEIPNSIFNYTYTPLKKISNNKWKSNHFDELFDSPFLLTDQTSDTFTQMGCLHEVVIQGEISEEVRKYLLHDLETITLYQSQMFDGNPNKYYLFIINMTEEGYGGLEHKACSVNIFNPLFDLTSEDYSRLLGLLCHEYFHLWNVKRIRPIALGPFDYNNYQLTNELWIAEGITSYYDNYILYCTSILDKEKYIKELLGDFNRLESSQGQEYMTLEESSFTAWTKYYKQHADSHNFGISYYIKGSIIALCIDITIRERTNLEFSLLNVLQFLYREYYEKLDRGFTKEQFFKAIKYVTKLDLLNEFNIYLTEKIRIPLEDYLKKIGIIFEKKIKDNILPFETKSNKGKEIVSKVYMQYLNKADISLGDELIAINSIRVKDSKYLDYISLKENKKIHILLSRRGKIVSRTIKLEKIYKYIYNSEKSKSESNLLSKNFFINEDK